MSYRSEQLRRKMEAIWRTPGVACPNHLVRWYNFETGYRYYAHDGSTLQYALNYKPGTLRRPKSKKVKGKGFSFLPKFYLLHYLARVSTPGEK